MLRIVFTWFAVAIGSLGLVASLPAQEEDDPEYRPGVVATFKSGATTVSRIYEDVQFEWGDALPDERLQSAGKWSARWQGRLFTIVPGEYRLHIYVAGNVTLRLGEQTLLEATANEPKWFDTPPFERTYGHHPFTLAYTPSGEQRVLKLYWSGPQFALEPIPDRHLFHEPGQTPSSAFESGRLLSHALQCGQCHRGEGELPAPRGPDLSHLSGNIEPAWIVERLTSATQASDDSADVLSRGSRMPHFAMPTADATAIAAWLTHATSPPPATLPSNNSPAKSSTSSKGKSKTRTEPDANEGRKLTHSLGCLACHRVHQAGTAQVFGGGDLSHIADKRPADFFARWLEAPHKLNERHRMPIFSLTPLERADVSLYLQSLRSNAPRAEVASGDELRQRGAQLFAAYRCAACHGSPTNANVAWQPVQRLKLESKALGCLGTAPPTKHAPAFGLRPGQIDALRQFIGHGGLATQPATSAPLILAERNCLACHARGAQPGLTPQLPQITQQVPELAPVLPTLMPPALTGVGDKLHDVALRAAIELKHGARRPWLAIRMPKFSLRDDELTALTQLLVAHDRVPARSAPEAERPLEPSAALAAQRLVTADGFGCTSCHKIGSSEPVKVALNAQGTDLTLLGERIRKPWFDRWVRNPARIIPRMEMPAIQKPVRGVLHDNVDEQLAAVWTTLNTPGFDPPPPNPVRVVRTTNLGNEREPAVVLTDVIEVSKQLFLRPLVIGLPNRHNLLFDLERGGLAAWWLGDTGRERTRGKSWYWESGSTSLFPGHEAFAIRYEGFSGWNATPPGQFHAELDTLEHLPQGVQFSYHVRFTQKHNLNRQEVVGIQETITPLADGGFLREIQVLPPSTATAIHFPLTPKIVGSMWHRLNDKLWSTGPDDNRLTMVLVEPHGAHFEMFDDALWIRGGVRGNAFSRPKIKIEYRSKLAADQYHPVEVKLPPLAPQKLNIVPGFEAVQLPLPADEMPTALAWRADGRLYFASLKGRVCTAIDSDGDGLEDRITPVSDDFAAPYGLHLNDDSIDVINKYALLRLRDRDGDGFYEQTEVLADDWGYTSDYHDWAVGLPKDTKGNYYVALPCQQDNRSAAAAHRRGTTLRLEPIARDPVTRRSYRVTQLTAGHRFPMGLALNRDQALFVTDNQGNYTPFNELNHLREGHRYGFINKLEAQPGFSPPFVSPAISIPHPWTRSVNGICFLHTPAAVHKRLGRDVFGPFEGHLVGCEYNGLSLVRMSLEAIGPTYQGAIYPLSVPPVGEQPTFEGPVVCEVSPTGDLYVGNMRDSGWGGGQNTGSIVRLRPNDTFPAGIAEVRARAEGFAIRFTRPIDPSKAADLRAYKIRSYRRIPTPAYGGNDVDERTEHVEHVQIAADRQSVELRLRALRTGFVYEIRLDNLGESGQTWHPAEAHYSLNEIPR